MAEALVLKKNESPTYFNKEALIGTLLAPGIGTIIGAMIGKSRMEEEAVNGKVVTDKPSFWNKDALLGGLLGDLVGAAIFVAVVGITAVSALVTGAPVVLGAGAIAAGLGWAASVAAGVYLGGKSGEVSEKKQFDQAKQQTIVYHISQTVSPEVGKAVEYSMQHNKEWGKQVTEDRLLADAKAHHHHV
jgi:hypothetical protein